MKNRLIGVCVVSWVTGSLLMALMMKNASAQTKDDEDINASQIHPRVAICRFDEAYSLPDEDEAPRLLPDVACAMPVSRLKQRILSREARVIDVRPGNDFDRFHIDGAMNVSVAELARKDYLKKAPVILVGDGRQDMRLYAGCGYLKGKGFENVFVMQGGMMSWISDRAPVVGQPVSMSSVRQLSASDLSRQVASEKSLYVFQVEEVRLGRHFTDSSRLNLIRNETLLSAVEHRIKRNGEPYLSVFLVGHDAADLHAKAEVIQKELGVPAFVYVDGVAVYEQVMAQQKAQAETRSRPPRVAQCPM